MKVVGIVAVAVIVGAVVLALMSGGEHGPGRHMPGDEGHTAPAQHDP